MIANFKDFLQTINEYDDAPSPNMDMRFKTVNGVTLEYYAPDGNLDDYKVRIIGNNGLDKLFQISLNVRGIGSYPEKEIVRRKKQFIKIAFGLQKKLSSGKANTSFKTLEEIVALVYRTNLQIGNAFVIGDFDKEGENNRNVRLGIVIPDNPTVFYGDGKNVKIAREIAAKKALAVLLRP